MQGLPEVRRRITTNNDEQRRTTEKSAKDEQRRITTNNGEPCSFGFVVSLSHFSVRLLISCLLLLLFPTTMPPKAAVEFPAETEVPPSQADTSGASTRKSRVCGKHITPQKRAAEFLDDMVVRQIKDEDQMWCKHRGQHVNHLEKTFSFFLFPCHGLASNGPPYAVCGDICLFAYKPRYFWCPTCCLASICGTKKDDEQRQTTTNNDKQRRTTF